MTRWLPIAGVGMVAAVFTWLNRGEKAILHLGLFTVYRVPLSVLVLGAFLLGMLAMFLLGLRHDRRVREALRASGADEDPTEPYPRDYAQT